MRIGPHGKKIYIAGPMTGYPDFNFPAFMAAEEKLSAEGWKVFNPATRDVEEGVVTNSEAFAAGDANGLMANGWNFREAYIWDIVSVINADAIYMLPGWEKGSGARAEHAAAVAVRGHYPEYQIIYG